jgi:hypothetical protein
VDGSQPGAVEIGIAVIWIDEPKSILESNRIGGAPADFAAPPVGKYEFSPVPSFRCHVAIEVGVEATR